MIFNFVELTSSSMLFSNSFDPKKYNTCLFFYYMF